MRTNDLEDGLEVAARDKSGSYERATIREVNKHEGHLVLFTTGKYRNTEYRITSHSIKSTWEDFLPEYTQRRREVLSHEMKKAQVEYDKNEKMQRLEVIREALKIFGIQAGIGNVYVPDVGYDPTIFVRYDHALELHRILTDYASVKLTQAAPTNDS